MTQEQLIYWNPTQETNYGNIIKEITYDGNKIDSITMRNKTTIFFMLSDSQKYIVPLSFYETYKDFVKGE